MIIAFGVMDRPMPLRHFLLGGCLWLGLQTIGAHAQTVSEDGMSYNLSTLGSFFDTTGGHPRIREVKIGKPPRDFPIALLDSVEPPAGTPVSGPPLRVLFIGNSLTFYNEMPRIFSAIAAKGLHRRVVVGLVSLPGGPPDLLWKLTDVQTIMRRLPWDDIVLQIRPYTLKDPKIKTYTKIYDLVAAAQHARMLIWVQPRSPDMSPLVQTVLDSVFAAAATNAGVALAPIPDAWNHVYQADTTLWHGLFYDLPHGNTHPSPIGSYLDALVLYRVITGQSPRGLPRQGGSASVSARDAAILQHAAADIPIAVTWP